MLLTTTLRWLVLTFVCGLSLTLQVCHTKAFKILITSANRVQLAYFNYGGSW